MHPERHEYEPDPNRPLGQGFFACKVCSIANEAHAIHELHQERLV